MKREAYPLEAARTVRAVAVDRAEGAMRRARGALQEAEAEAARAARTVASFRQSERERRERAPKPAIGAALQRQVAFDAKQQTRLAALLRALRQAQASVRSAQRAASEARRSLGAAHVDEKVVETHHERWAAERRRAAERREDEALEENSRT